MTNSVSDEINNIIFLKKSNDKEQSQNKFLRLDNFEKKQLKIATAKMNYNAFQDKIKKNEFCLIQRLQIALDELIQL